MVNPGVTDQQPPPNAVKIDLFDIMMTTNAILYRLPLASSAMGNVCLQAGEVDTVCEVARTLSLTHAGQSYRPSGHTEWQTVLKGVGACLLITLPLAWIFSILPWSLILLSALILAGISISIANRYIVTRSMTVAVVLGLLLGGGSYLAWQYFEYVEFREALHGKIQDVRHDLTRAQGNMIIDNFLEAETGSPGVLGYIKISSREPEQTFTYETTQLPSFAEMVGTVANVNFVDINGKWVLVVMAGEFLGATILGVGLMVSRVRKPYCETDAMDMKDGRLFPVMPADAVRISAAFLQVEGDADHPLLNRLRALKRPSFLHTISCPVCHQSYLRWELRGAKNAVLHSVPLGKLSGPDRQRLDAVTQPLIGAFMQRAALIHVATLRHAQRQEPEGTVHKRQ